MPKMLSKELKISIKMIKNVVKMKKISIPKMLSTCVENLVENNWKCCQNDAKFVKNIYNIVKNVENLVENHCKMLSKWSEIRQKCTIFFFKRVEI